MLNDTAKAEKISKQCAFMLNYAIKSRKYRSSPPFKPVEHAAACFEIFKNLMSFIISQSRYFESASADTQPLAWKFQKPNVIEHGPRGRERFRRALAAPQAGGSPAGPAANHRRQGGNGIFGGNAAQSDHAGGIHGGEAPPWAAPPEGAKAAAQEDF
jgi:hypothetical protein